MNQRSLIAIIILAGIGSIGSVLAYTGTISAGQGNFNNVLVTGTCTGCGGGEGSFTSYSTILNQTITGTTGWPARYLFVSNDGSNLGADNEPRNFLILLNGTVKFTQVIANSGFDKFVPEAIQSPSGEYKAILNTSGNTISIYKNNVFLQNIGINLSQFSVTGLDSNDFAINISSDGKYISLFSADITGSVDRIVEFRGS